MKNTYINHIFFLITSLFVINSCTKTEVDKSEIKTISAPFIALSNLQSTYAYGFGQTHIYSDIPDIVGVAVDSIVGFQGGHGGLTGFDSINILKSDITGWPDTVAVGGYVLKFQKFNNTNYKTSISANVVIADPIAPPNHAGPTDLAGTYKRTSNGRLIQLLKVFDGVYVIDNPGGAGVDPFPYLLFNYDNGSGGDMLVFAIQPNPCGGGLQLVGPTAPFNLTSAEYSAQYPPVFTSLSPITLQWRVFEFPAVSASASNNGTALCQWGTGIRTFVKQ